MTVGMNVSKSSVVSASSRAFSETPLATVNIVPSFGFMTALYAVAVARSVAEAKICTSIWSCSRIAFVNPRKSWDKMTPEFPRAPRRDPEEIAFDTVSMSADSSEVTSFAADMIVSVMFVPVSPSGTGNTFSSLIISFFASRLAAPARNIFVNSSAFIVFVATIIILLNQSLLHLQRRC